MLGLAALWVGIPETHTKAGQSCARAPLLVPHGRPFWQAVRHTLSYFMRRAGVITRAEPELGAPATGAKLGLLKGMAVQELGWDEDVDEALRDQLMEQIEADFIFEAVEAVDVVLLWWRDDDGDLVDGLMDALRDLSETGLVWLLTPKIGRDGFVDPADLAEGAIAGGLTLTGSAQVSPDWQAQKLVRPKTGRK